MTKAGVKEESKKGKKKKAEVAEAEVKEKKAEMAQAQGQKVPTEEGEEVVTEVVERVVAEGGEKDKKELDAGKAPKVDEEKMEAETMLEEKVESGKEAKKAETVAVEDTEQGKEKETEVMEMPGEEKAEPSSEKNSRIDEIISTVEKMTVLELSDLVKRLEERFGVVAAAPVAAGPATSLAAAEEEKEKTEWSVHLTAVGEKKIQVIKEVRAVTNLGLKEAKTLVEEAPKPVKEGIQKKEAEEIKSKLEAAGATVELK